MVALVDSPGRFSVKKPTNVTLPGNGVGQLTLAESLRVLEAAGFQANFVQGKESSALRQRTVGGTQNSAL